VHLYADVLAQGCVGLKPNIDFFFSVNAATARTLLHSVGKSWLQNNRAVRVCRSDFQVRVHWQQVLTCEMLIHMHIHYGNILL